MHKNRSMETNKDTILADNTRDNNGVDKDSGSGGGKKLRDLKCILDL